MQTGAPPNSQPVSRHECVHVSCYVIAAVQAWCLGAPAGRPRSSLSRGPVQPEACKARLEGLDGVNQRCRVSLSVQSPAKTRDPTNSVSDGVGQGMAQRCGWQWWLNLETPKRAWVGLGRRAENRVPGLQGTEHSSPRAAKLELARNRQRGSRGPSTGRAGQEAWRDMAGPVRASGVAGQHCRASTFQVRPPLASQPQLPRPRPARPCLLQAQTCLPPSSAGVRPQPCPPCLPVGVMAGSSPILALQEGSGDRPRGAGQDSRASLTLMPLAFTAEARAQADPGGFLCLTVGVVQGWEAGMRGYLDMAHIPMLSWPEHQVLRQVSTVATAQEAPSSCPPPPTHLSSSGLDGRSQPHLPAQGASYLLDAQLFPQL